MHTDTLPVRPGRPEDRRLIKELNEEGQMSQKLSRALQTAAVAGLGILAAIAFAAAAPMDVQAGEWESLGTFKTTGYCNCRKCAGRWAGGATASGAMPEEGVTIAVDRSVIPLGAHILIDGHEFVAQDTGVRGKHIDVYYEDHDDAWDHGTQHKQVFIWRED